MIFLLEYDRPTQTLISLEEYPDLETGQEAMFALEKQRLRELGNMSREIVILEAENLDAIKRTHSRYFLTGPELIEKVKTDINRRLNELEEGLR